MSLLFANGKRTFGEGQQVRLIVCAILLLSTKTLLSLQPFVVNDFGNSGDEVRRRWYFLIDFKNAKVK